MLHYVHQLVANFVRLLPGEELVVYSEFLEKLCENTESEPTQWSFKSAKQSPERRYNAPYSS